jgi:hypothetical protein
VWCYQHHLAAEVDGRNFDKECEESESEDEREFPRMREIAQAIWAANGDYCRITWELGIVPWDASGAFEREDFEQ